MPRYLGIDWDEAPDGKTHLLRVVEATVKRGTVTVGKAVSWPEAFSPNPVQAAEAGKRLRERLKEAGISPAPVLFTVARNRVVFREVRFPDVPADEVPAVVNFQAAKELAFPPEDAVIDYALSSRPGPAGDKRALVVVLHAELLKAIKQTCATAGLRLESVSVRPFAILANWQAQAVVRPDEAGEVHAILVATNSGGELCVARGSELLFSRAVFPTATGDNGSLAAFLPELRRSLAAYGTQYPQAPVRALYVEGSKSATDHAAVADALGIEVRPFGPPADSGLSDPSDQGAFAGALGMVQARAIHGRLPVDFLSPKQPRKPVNVNRRKLVAAAAGVVVLLGALGALYGGFIWLRNSDIEALQERKAQLEAEIKGFGDLDKRYEAFNTWSGGEMVMLDELFDLIAQFPDQPDIRITEVHWAPAAASPNAPAKKPVPGVKTTTPPAAKPVGDLTIVAAGDVSALARLRTALEAAPHWKLDLWDPDTTPRQARATLKVNHTAPEKYQASLDKAKPPSTSGTSPGTSTGSSMKSSGSNSRPGRTVGGRRF